MFCFSNWVLVTQMCSICENSLRCTFMICILLSIFYSHKKVDINYDKVAGGVSVSRDETKLTVAEAGG